MANLPLIDERTANEDPLEVSGGLFLERVEYWPAIWVGNSGSSVPWLAAIPGMRKVPIRKVQSEKAPVSRRTSSARVSTEASRTDPVEVMVIRRAMNGVVSGRRETAGAPGSDNTRTGTMDNGYRLATTLMSVWSSN
jgi:hypothetical protein